MMFCCSMYSERYTSLISGFRRFLADRPSVKYSPNLCEESEVKRAVGKSNNIWYAIDSGIDWQMLQQSTSRPGVNKRRKISILVFHFYSSQKDWPKVLRCPSHWAGWHRSIDFRIFKLSRLSLRKRDFRTNASKVDSDIKACPFLIDLSKIKTALNLDPV